MKDGQQDILALQQSVFSCISTSRERLRQGMVDISGVEAAVRGYCEALAALPLEEGRGYVESLQQLTEAMNALEDELQRARAKVQQELTSLSHQQKAHSAYIKTDGIGEKYIAPTSPDEAGA